MFIVFTISAYAATVDLDGFVWGLSSDGETAVLKEYKGTATSLNLPSTYNGKSYDIGVAAFQGNTNLETITTGNNVINIADYAFDGCTNLKSVIFGTRVASIGTYAFRGCENLYKTIFLANTVPMMTSYTFSSLSGRRSYVANGNYDVVATKYNLGTLKIFDFLSSMFEVNGVRYAPVVPNERTCEAIDCSYTQSEAVVNIGEYISYKGIQMKVLEINPYCFYGNNYVNSVDLSFKGNIGEYAFMNNGSIATITLSNEGVVAGSAFRNCKNLQTAEISNKGDIGEYAFGHCTNLQTAIISNEGSIGSYAFQYCTGLESVELNSSVTNILDHAFYRSFSEVSKGTVTISNSGIIGEYAFADCAGLSHATITSNVTGVSY